MSYEFKRIKIFFFGCACMCLVQVKKKKNILEIFFGIIHTYKQNHVIDCNQEYKDFICSLILYCGKFATFNVILTKQTSRTEENPKTEIIKGIETNHSRNITPATKKATIKTTITWK